MDKIGDSSFIFLSDDMDWVRENFKGDNIWKSPFNEIGDLKIMTMCDNNIIANSSFSWWGAYLNKNRNKTLKSKQRSSKFNLKLKYQRPINHEKINSSGNT